MTNQIIVYSIPHCVQCTQTKRHLARRGVTNFLELDLSQDPVATERFKAEGLLSAPIVVTPSGQTWSGYRPDRLDAAIADLAELVPSNA